MAATYCCNRCLWFDNMLLKASPPLCTYDPGWKRERTRLACIWHFAKQTITASVRSVPFRVGDGPRGCLINDPFLFLPPISLPVALFSSWTFLIKRRRKPFELSLARSLGHHDKETLSFFLSRAQTKEREQTRNVGENITDFTQC